MRSIGSTPRFSLGSADVVFVKVAVGVSVHSTAIVVKGRVSRYVCGANVMNEDSSRSVYSIQLP